jgi:hypothetical protein
LKISLLVFQNQILFPESETPPLISWEEGAKKKEV